MNVLLADPKKNVNARILSLSVIVFITVDSGSFSNMPVYLFISFIAHLPQFVGKSFLFFFLSSNFNLIFKF